MCDRCLPDQTRRSLLLRAAALPLALTLPRPDGPARATAQTVTPGLAIHPRSDWAGDSRPPKGPIAAEDVRFLLVHHTAGSNSYDEASVAGQIRGMYDFHTGPEKGWPDVAYNFLIDRFGGVWEARAGALAGAVSGDATGGNQGFAQLVSLMGDFSNTLPTDAALSSLRATLAWLADRHSLDTSQGTTTSFESKGSNRHSSGTTVTTPTINGHRSMSQTSCPGDVLFGYVSGDLMNDVSGLRVGAPSSSTSALTPTPTTSSPSSTEPLTTTASLPEPSITQGQTSVPTTAPATSGSATGLDVSSSVSAQEGGADTVGGVAAPSTPQSSDDSAGGFSASEGLGLAGAAAVAAVVGLLAIRNRDVEESS